MPSVLLTFFLELFFIYKTCTLHLQLPTQQVSRREPSQKRMLTDTTIPSVRMKKKAVETRLAEPEKEQ